MSHQFPYSCERPGKRSWKRLRFVVFCLLLFCWLTAHEVGLIPSIHPHLCLKKTYPSTTDLLKQRRGTDSYYAAPSVYLKTNDKSGEMKSEAIYSTHFSMSLPFFFSDIYTFASWHTSQQHGEQVHPASGQRSYEAETRSQRQKERNLKQDALGIGICNRILFPLSSFQKVIFCRFLPSILFYFFSFKFIHLKTWKIVMWP